MYLFSDSVGSSSRATSAGKTLAYRPDIDGLRAIAVAAVVFYHAGIKGMPGGFVGVDIFFVISGYLVGGQIFREAIAGEFSFSRFYARRARRILPAFYALLLVLIVIALLISTPQELRQLAGEAVGAVLGLSNVLYYLGGGYFAPAADYNPLLMTWSLGVEEQFYVLFPLLVLGLVHGRISPLRALLVVLLLSFTASILILKYDPNAAFYLLPIRAWELMLGATLALCEHNVRTFFARNVALEHGIALAGVALIVVSIAFYDATYPFPGVFVALPTLGTALLIASPGSAINVGILSSGMMTFVGGISYSWYLWHWPLFYLNRILGAPDGGVPSIVLILASLLVSILSWRFIEQRFRRQEWSPKRTLTIYGMIGAGFVALNLMLYSSDGWPQRFSPKLQEFAESARRSRQDSCLAPYGRAELQNPSACLPSDPAGRVVLFGDSHASALAPGIRSWARTAGLGFSEMAKSSCHPFFGYAAESPQRPSHWSECIAYQQAALAYIERNPDIRVVVLAGFWSSSDRFRAGKAGPDQQLNVPLQEALTATVRKIKTMGLRVVLVNDVPLFRFDPYARTIGSMIPARAIIGSWIGSKEVGSFVAGQGEIVPDPSAKILADVARQEGVTRFDPYLSLCNEQGCRFGTSEALYYFDFQHVTPEGAIAALAGLAER